MKLNWAWCAVAALGLSLGNTESTAEPTPQYKHDVMVFRIKQAPNKDNLAAPEEFQYPAQIRNKFLTTIMGFKTTAPIHVEEAVDLLINSGLRIPVEVEYETGVIQPPLHGPNDHPGAPQKNSAGKKIKSGMITIDNVSTQSSIVALSTPYSGKAEDLPKPAIEYLTDGMIDRIEIEKASTQTLIRAILEPLSLDYLILPGRIRISTPEKLKVYADANGIADENAPMSVPQSKFHFGDTILELDGGDLIWTGLPIGDNSAIELMATPTLITLSNQPATIIIATDQEIEFFKEVGVGEQSMKVYASTLRANHPLNLSYSSNFKNKPMREILDELIKQGNIEEDIHTPGSLKYRTTLNLESIPVWRAIEVLLKTKNFEMVYQHKYNQFSVRRIRDVQWNGERAFTLETETVKTGVEIGLETTSVQGDHLQLNVQYKIDIFDRLEKIEGTELIGGKPVMNSLGVDMNYDTEFGKWVSMLTDLNGTDQALMLFKVERWEQ